MAKARPSDTSGQKLWALDNGRVLGYDNNHGHHHRHFMGQVEAVEFESYEATAAQLPQLQAREIELANRICNANRRKRTSPDFSYDA